MTNEFNSVTDKTFKYQTLNWKSIALMDWVRPMNISTQYSSSHSKLRFTNISTPRSLKLTSVHSDEILLELHKVLYNYDCDMTKFKHKLKESLFKNTPLLIAYSKYYGIFHSVNQEAAIDMTFRYLNDPYMVNLLGRAYIKSDEKKAELCLQKSAKAGCIDAMWNLSMYYYMISNRTSPSQRIIDLYKKNHDEFLKLAVINGHPHALLWQSKIVDDKYEAEELVATAYSKGCLKSLNYMYQSLIEEKKCDLDPIDDIIIDELIFAHTYGCKTDIPPYLIKYILRLKRKHQDDLVEAHTTTVFN